MNMPLKIKIIIGSTRKNRFSEKPAQWIFEEAKKLEGVAVELLDLRDFAMPFFESAVPPSLAKGNYENEVVNKWSAKIADGDAFIVVTPEYNHGYPAVLKNAMDVVYTEWNRKPIGFVSYGSAVGARSVEQLRQVSVELQMAPIRNAIHIPTDIFFAAVAGKGSSDPIELFAPIRQSIMGDRLQIFFNDLMWWSQALKTAREAV